MAVGLSIRHSCTRCSHVQNITKVAAARRNGTRCPRCGGNMEPSTAEGWAKLAEAHSAKAERITR